MDPGRTGSPPQPHPDARTRLQRHLEWNDVAARVEVQPIALSDRQGTAQMYQSHHTALASLVPTASPVRAARVITLNSWPTVR